MKNVIAAAALSLVLSDFAYAHEQRDEAMMKITPSTLADADIQAVSPGAGALRPRGHQQRPLAT